MIEDYYFNSIYKEISRLLLYSPHYKIVSKDGEHLNELVDFRFVLKNPINCFALVRNMSIPYLKGEIEFYLSGSPFVKDIAKYSKFWQKISDDGRTINSNYGKLIFHDRNLHNYTQFEYAKEMLLRNIDSKKAVMTIYNKDHSYKSKDNPCTMFLQFLIRNNKLHLFVKMRSSDVWFGLPYDVPFFCFVLCKMYEDLKYEHGLEIKLGNYTHQSTSLHLYLRNEKTLLEAILNYKEDFLRQEQREYFKEVFKPYLNYKEDEVWS